MWMSSSVQTGVIGCLFNSPPSWCLIGETALMSICVSHTEPPLIDLRPISLVGLGEGLLLIGGWGSTCLWCGPVVIERWVVVNGDPPRVHPPAGSMAPGMAIRSTRFVSIPQLG